MKSKAILLLALAFVSVAIAWHFWWPEKTVWSNEVPEEFRGEWVLIRDRFTDNYGTRGMRLGETRIELRVASETTDEWGTFLVRRVSLTASDPDLMVGELVVFYGDTDETVIAKRRLQILFGPKEMISASQIVGTGNGADAYFSLGDFVRVEPTRESGT